MAYLLDTDSLTLAFAGNQRVLARIQKVPSAELWLSSIAAEKSLRGALSLISRSRDGLALPAAYDFLTRLLDSICQQQIHPYNADAARVYASFSAQVKRVRTQDCRIAASAIAQGWVVVTANQKDFSKTPGVQFEDRSR